MKKQGEILLGLSFCGTFPQQLWIGKVPERKECQENLLKKKDGRGDQDWGSCLWVLSRCLIISRAKKN